MAVFQEENFEFDFGNATVEKLDKQGRKMPTGMSLVDFVIEEEDHTLLVEVKDPARGKDPLGQQRDYIKRMRQKPLVQKELTPKMRDSYCFLHLMRRDPKRCICVVLLGLDAEPFDVALLGPVKTRLLARLRQEAYEPWKREYVADCIVVTPDQWRKHFKNYPLKRPI